MKKKIKASKHLKEKKNKDNVEEKKTEVVANKVGFNWLIFRWFFLLVAILLLLVLLGSWGMEVVYGQRVAGGMKLGGVTVGGMSKQQLTDFFTEQDEKLTNGFSFVLNNQEVATAKLADLGLEVDLPKCQEKVLFYDKSGSFWQRQKTRLLAWLGKTDLQCEVYFDEAQYDWWLADLKAKIDQPSKPFGVEKKDDQLVISAGQKGKIIDRDKLKTDLLLAVKNLDWSAIEVPIKTEEPLVSERKAQDVLEQGNQVLQKEKIDLVYKDWKMELTRDDLWDWMKFEWRETKPPEGDYVLTYDLDLIDEYFDWEAADFEIKPEDARLRMTEQGVQVESEGTDGLLVNRVKFLAILEKELFDPKVTVIDLPVEETKAVVNGKDVGQLGIVELLAYGESDFSWSPANRVHNIAVGAEKFSGTVIAPGEEFSFTSRLGVVGPAEGFLPELVIADNETRPEYGGGLCQVSTTMFRAAINAGLPITERHPHQYRVAYYEPAGMDATIYVPSPDLRFVNNTGNYILIEAVVGDYTLRFNFYGKKDGRSVEVTEPNIYNITSPPAPVYIYTSSLAPGEKYQVDSAHYGADAVFYRTITMPDGQKNTEEFFSRYQAWPAKYKIGEGEVKKEINNEQLIINNNDKKDGNAEDKENDLSTTA